MSDRDLKNNGIVPDTDNGLNGFEDTGLHTLADGVMDKISGGSPEINTSGEWSNTGGPKRPARADDNYFPEHKYYIDRWTPTVVIKPLSCTEDLKPVRELDIKK